MGDISILALRVLRFLYTHSKCVRYKIVGPQLFLIKKSLHGCSIDYAIYRNMRLG